jgi:subtilisin family serine protease
MAGALPEWPEQGMDGEGVIVAVIDSGIDIRHEDFLDDDGRSRVLFLVDLSQEPQGAQPELEERIGAAVWSNEDIDAQLWAEEAGEEPAYPVTERDTFGHGTHVTSVAAGRLGLARVAWIVSVRAARNDWPVSFEDTDVLEAARFVFELSEELGLPCVLLLALGGHQGGHDGTSLLELGLADLVGGDAGDLPGRAIVVAAGNSGHCQDHAGGSVDGLASRHVSLEVAREDPSLEVDLELWYPPSAEISVGLRTPAGELLYPVPAGSELRWSGPEASVIVSNAPEGRDPLSGDSRALVSLRPRLPRPVAAGLYTVTLQGHGRFDAYLSWASLEQLHGAASLESPLEPDGTLTVPATSPALIAVGATVSRAGWVDEAGRPQRDDRFREGGLASYSGAGPTRVSELKPDIVAPGHAVLGALSRDAEPPSPLSVFTPISSLMPDRYRIVAPGNRAALWGTSVAAPHVAGAVALLFQRDPSLTQERLRSLLITTARTDGGARGRGWSPRWGFGSLDAGRALTLLEEGFGEIPEGTASSLGVSSDLVPVGGCLTVTIVPRDLHGAPVGPGRFVELAAEAGQIDSVEDLGNGVYLAQWCAEGVPLGSTVELTARADGVDLERSITVWVATDRHSLGAWATLSGGCSASMPGGSRPSILRSLVGLLAP